MRILGDLLLIIGAAIPLLTLALQGKLRAVPELAMILIIIVAVVALRRRLIFSLLTVGMSLYAFAHTYGDGRPAQVLAALAPLFVILLGFYIMFRGLTGRRE